MSIIFIGGFLRSGTMLLQSILCASPDSNPMIGEAIYLRGSLENYSRCLSMFDLHARFYFSSPEELRQLCARDVGEFVKKTAKRYGDPKHIVLKHPQLTPYFPRLHELLPSAKFLVIVRDPRDTVASAVRAQKNDAGEFGNSPPAGIAQTLLNYYVSCLKSRSKSFTDAVMYVKYESLVNETRATLTKIQDFSKIDLTRVDTNSRIARDNEYFNDPITQKNVMYSDLYRQPISARRVGVFRDVLEEGDVVRIERICQMLFSSFGYIPSSEVGS